MGQRKKIKTIFDKDGPFDMLMKIKGSTPELAKYGLKFAGEEAVKLARDYILHKREPYRYKDVPWQPLNPYTAEITFRMSGHERNPNNLPLLDTGRMADSLKVSAIGVASNRAFATISSDFPGFAVQEYGGVSPVTGGAIPPRPSVRPAIEQLKHSRSFKNELKARMVKAVNLAAKGKNFKSVFEVGV